MCVVIVDIFPEVDTCAPYPKKTSCTNQVAQRLKCERWRRGNFNVGSRVDSACHGFQFAPHGCPDGDE
eukprot:9483536-Pyramimonas_sp.AAC.2